MPAFLLLDAMGIDFQALDAVERLKIKAIFFAVATVLLIPTVLIALLAGKKFDKRPLAKN